MSLHVEFGRKTKFLGRNGLYNCKGLRVSVFDNSEIEIEPITGTGKVGRCSIRIPAEDIYRVIATIQHIAGATGMSPETRWSDAAFMDLVVQMAENEIQRRVSGMPVYWKIPVIKAYRIQTGLGLKESKEAIDAWQETESGKKIIARWVPDSENPGQRQGL